MTNLVKANTGSDPVIYKDLSSSDVLIVKERARQKAIQNYKPKSLASISIDAFIATLNIAVFVFLSSWWLNLFVGILLGCIALDNAMKRSGKTLFLNKPSKKLISSEETRLASLLNADLPRKYRHGANDESREQWAVDTKQSGEQICFTVFVYSKSKSLAFYFDKEKYPLAPKGFSWDWVFDGEYKNDNPWSLHPASFSRNVYYSGLDAQWMVRPIGHLKSNLHEAEAMAEEINSWAASVEEQRFREQLEKDRQLEEEQERKELAGFKANMLRNY